MKIKAIITLVTLGIAFNLQAQSYDFSLFTNDYNDLVGSTSLNNGMTWDDPNFTVPIGFDFEYFGQTLTELFITDEGLGGFLATDSSFLAERNTYLIPYGADIIDRGYDFDDDNAMSLSNISYLTEGDPGSRILKLEWNNVGFYGELEADDISTDYTNIQLWLYEGTNVIEVRIGDNSITQPDLCFDFETGSAVVLIEEYNIADEILTGEGLCLEGNAASPSLKVLQDIEELTFLDGVIPSGTVFRFTPTTTSIPTSPGKNLDVSIFPNPVGDELTISIDKTAADILNIFVYNAKGKLVKMATGQDQTINVTDLAAGGYVVEIETSMGKISKKIVKR